MWLEKNQRLKNDRMGEILEEIIEMNFLKNEYKPIKCQIREQKKSSHQKMFR